MVMVIVAVVKVIREGVVMVLMYVMVIASVVVL